MYRRSVAPPTSTSTNSPSTPIPTSSPLRADRVTVGYGGPPIIGDLSTRIPAGTISVIVGANGCGKSTLLRAFGRLLAPSSGAIVLDGCDISARPTKQVARRLGLLPQGPTAPEGVTVEDLVRRGRFPHQRLFDQWSKQDARAVDRALERTGLEELRSRAIDELSGGQRQRAWIAMALAQDTPLMLLDEPTTYLDIAHQMEVLDLLADLNENEGRTIVMVLHDLNQACRYASHLIAMVDGGIAAEGAPDQVVNAALIADVFGLATQVIADPVTGCPLCLPLSRADRRRDGHNHPTQPSIPTTRNQEYS